MSKKLFIDTTNNYCFLAIYINDKLILSKKIKVNKNVTEIIIFEIKEILAHAKINFNELTHLSLNIGPGSFTGIKVGVVIAKVSKLVYPNLKIETINSLILQTRTFPCISIIDAKSNKYYLAIYDVNKIIVKPCLVDQLVLNKYINKYKNFLIIKNNTNNMYKNFLFHKNNFKKIKNIKKLEPCYLKNPV